MTEIAPKIWRSGSEVLERYLPACLHACPADLRAQMQQLLTDIAPKVCRSWLSAQPKMHTLWLPASPNLLQACSQPAPSLFPASSQPPPSAHTGKPQPLIHGTCQAQAECEYW